MTDELKALKRLPVGRRLLRAQELNVKYADLQRQVEQAALDALRPALKLMVTAAREHWVYPAGLWQQLERDNYWFAFTNYDAMIQSNADAVDNIEGQLTFEPDGMRICIPGHDWYLPCRDPQLVDILQDLTMLAMKPQDAKVAIVKSSELRSWSPRQVFKARGYSRVKRPGGDPI